MNSHAWARRAAIGLLSLALAACGGGGGEAPPAAPPASVGAAGGTVSGTGGAQVVVPAGALAQGTAIAVAQTSTGAPPLPAGVTSAGAVFAFTPHGTSFATPATVTVPFDPAAVPAGATPTLYKTNAAQSAFEPVPGATVNGASMTGQVTGFSLFTVGSVPPLTKNDPLREWEFSLYPSNGQAAVQLDGGTLAAGQLFELADFGPAFFDGDIVLSTQTLLADGRANGTIFSSAGGGIYSVLAEAPYGRLNGPTPIGSVSRLKQTQSFVKNAADATLTFTLTSVVIDVRDFNATSILPSEQSDPLKGEVLLSVGAYKTPQDYFFYTAGRASVRGHNGFWLPRAEDESFSRSHLWSLDDFDFSSPSIAYSVGGSAASGSCPGSMGLLKLKAARTYQVDLSSVAVGEEFTLRTDTFAETHNRRGGGSIDDCQASSAHAFLRDPQAIGGATLSFTGLQPTNNPLAPPPAQVLSAPASCVPGPAPDPASGVLQFDAAAYTVEEFAGAVPTITVTRTGGTRGAVSATFTTSDGTAIGGTDYTPVNATVFFADGDSGQRVVTVPILQDLVLGPDKTVNLTLSQPGGCAALGAQTAAVLTIRDDRATPVPSFTVGGTVTGLVGTGLVLQDLTFQPITPGNGAFTFAAPTRSGSAYAVTVVTQPSNPLQVCTVSNGSGVVANANIGNVAVNCAVPPANGALDATFGSAGRVSGGAAGNADAMALQTDGKAVTVGGAFTLTRRNADGSADAGFGAGGKVTTVFSAGASGSAADVAVQGDGRIVVVGKMRDAAVSGGDNFGLRRYNADGSADTGFGTGGAVYTDFSGLVDEAKAVAIQADGKIVVAGQALGATTDFAVARYNADGSLDTSFGTGGKVTTDATGGTDFLSALAIQPDGKIVVLGAVSLAGSPFVELSTLVRYNANGSLDTGFGAGGKVIAAGDRPSSALALQADGRILVGGTANAGTINAVFGLMRFLADGSVDNTFGAAGTVTTPFITGGNGSAAFALALQADGKSVLVGHTQSGGFGTADIAIARYGTTGQLDPTFATGGKLMVDFFAADDFAADVAIQGDGRIVVAATVRNGTQAEFALVRINP